LVYKNTPVATGRAAREMAGANITVVEKW